MSDETMRFSDEELSTFHKQFQRHIEMYNERIKTDDARYNSMLVLQQNNSMAIKSLVENTEDIIKLHHDLRGAARLGDRVQRMCLWFAKWGIIGAGVIAIFKWFMVHLPR